MNSDILALIIEDERVYNTRNRDQCNVINIYTCAKSVGILFSYRLY